MALGIEKPTERFAALEGRNLLEYLINKFNHLYKEELAAQKELLKRRYEEMITPAGKEV